MRFELIQTEHNSEHNSEQPNNRLIPTADLAPEIVAIHRNASDLILDSPSNV